MAKKLPRPSPEDAPLLSRLKNLGLNGLVARWDEFQGAPWIEELVACEEDERRRRSLERRLGNARLGRFKSIADFEWDWPRKIDHDLIHDLLRLDFVTEAANVVLIGPNGVGKTMIAQNLAQQAVLKGHTVRFSTASEMLNDLAAQESASALSRRLRRYVYPSLLVIDEVGYLSYNSRHADLLFEIVSKRHQHKSTIVTTNRAFTEWNDVFPNAASVVALIDRLVHRAEIVEIDGKSYRLKEATERSESRRLKSSGNSQRKNGKGSK